MNSNRLILAAFFLTGALCASVEADSGKKRDPRFEAIDDHLESADIIINGLAVLGNPPTIYKEKPVAAAPSPKHGKGAAAAKAASADNQSRDLVKTKKTVYGEFKLKIKEFKDHFEVLIESSVAMQEVIVKDFKSQKVLGKRYLNDQKTFKGAGGAITPIICKEPLSADIGLSIAVNMGEERGEQSIVRAAFKVLE